MIGKTGRLRGLSAGWCLLLAIAGNLGAQEIASGPFETEFHPASLPPVPDHHRELKAADVKRYWISQLPQVHPPSRSSPGYAYDMPHYRRRLEARNRLVEGINQGLVDEKAECETLRHNLRHFRNRGRTEKVKVIEREILRREAIRKGDLAGLLVLDELESRHPPETERLLQEQAELIRELRREIEALRSQVQSARNP